MSSRVKNILPKTGIGKSLLLLLSGTAAAQAITAASMPIVTRLYTPEMIGIISVYLSFFNFWRTLLTWRYESALLVSVDEEESHHVFRLGALLAFFTSLLAIPALLGLQKAELLGFNVLPSWAPLVAFLSLLGYGWFMLYRSWLLRLRDVRVISLSTVARSGSNVGARISAGALSFGVFGLFFAEIVGSWAALGAVRKRTRQLLKFASPDWCSQKIKITALKYRKFAQFEMPSVAVDQLAIALPVPIIAMLYGPQAAGWFGLARLLYAIPNGQIGKTAGDVFQMEFGSCIRKKNHREGEKLFYKFSLGLFVIGLVPLFLAIYAAPPLVPYIFGEEWRNMGAIVSTMAPWMFTALVVSSMSRALSVLQKQHWKLLYDVSALLVVLLLYVLSKERGLELMEFVSYLSYGLAVTYVLYFVVIALSIRFS
ncbi:MAG: lipopolysaccharide biosynthesis protein [Marinobacter sp.]